MSLTNVINEWKAMPKTNLESDIGVLMDMIKTNSTLKVHTFYNEDTLYNGNDDFILCLVSISNLCTLQEQIKYSHATFVVNL